MANNCLKTTLKASVDNSRLVHLGAFGFDVISGDDSATKSSFYFSCKSGKSVTFRALNGGYFSESYAGLDSEETRLTEKTYNNTTNIALYFANANFRVECLDGYDGLSQLILSLGTSYGDNDKTRFKFDAISFAYHKVDYVLTFVHTEVDGDLAQCVKPTQSNITFNKVINGSLNLDDLQLGISFVAISIVDMNNAARGNVTSFANALSLRNLYLQYTHTITGALEDLAAAQVSKGRTSGILEIRCNNTVTVNGVKPMNMALKKIQYGTSMENPTTEETAQGYKIV
jgi:hypothetical protein